MISAKVRRALRKAVSPEVIGQTTTPTPASKKVYDKLFEDYKRIYYSLEKAYKLANGARFSESEE